MGAQGTILQPSAGSISSEGLFRDCHLVHQVRGKEQMLGAGQGRGEGEWEWGGMGWIHRTGETLQGDGTSVSILETRSAG